MYKNLFGETVVEDSKLVAVYRMINSPNAYTKEQWEKLGFKSATDVFISDNRFKAIPGYKEEREAFFQAADSYYLGGYSDLKNGNPKVIGYLNEMIVNNLCVLPSSEVDIKKPGLLIYNEQSAEIKFLGPFFSTRRLPSYWAVIDTCASIANYKDLEKNMPCDRIHPSSDIAELYETIRDTKTKTLWNAMGRDGESFIRLEQEQDSSITMTLTCGGMDYLARVNFEPEEIPVCMSSVVGRNTKDANMKLFEYVKGLLYSGNLFDFDFREGKIGENWSIIENRNNLANLYKRLLPSNKERKIAVLIEQKNRISAPLFSACCSSGKMASIVLEYMHERKDKPQTDVPWNWDRVEGIINAGIKEGHGVPLKQMRLK